MIFFVLMGYFCGVYVINVLNGYNLYNVRSYCNHIQCYGSLYIAFGLIDIIFLYRLTKLFRKRVRHLLDMSTQYSLNFVNQKMRVLCTVSIISSVLFISLSGINPYIKPYLLFGIDLIINNIILILSFGKSNNIYKSICCCFLPLLTPKLTEIKSYSTKSIINGKSPTTPGNTTELGVQTTHAPQERRDSSHTNPDMECKNGESQTTDDQDSGEVILIYIIK